MILLKSKKNLLDKVNKINEKENSKPIKVSKLKKRIKNSKIFTNIKSINDDGLLNLLENKNKTITSLVNRIIEILNDIEE